MSTPLSHSARTDAAQRDAAQPPAPPCALPDSPLAELTKGLDACVHCGFCLPACPTYVTLHDENDSPRGRLLLMRRLLDGELPLNDPDVGVHFDRCLGCRACETACPSGVPYGELLEATRATMRPVRPLSGVAATVLALFRRPRALSAVLAGARLLRRTRVPDLLARVLPQRLAFPFWMLASTAPVRLAGIHGPATQSAAPGTLPLDAPEVALLEGCVMAGLYSHTNAATRRVLRATGYREVPAREQGCCGALHAHAGDLDAARELAKRNIIAFERTPNALIAVNSAGCGAMLKDYGHLFHADPAWHARAEAVAGRTRDISELAVAGPRSLPTVAQSDESRRSAEALPRLRVTYDPPCHLMHAQRVTQPPLTLLAHVPGIDLVPLPDADQCCGSAGIYNLVEPDTSDAVLAPKLAHISHARVELVASGNPGCLMQLGAGLQRSGSAARAVHPVELLDAAIRRAPR